MKIVKIDPNKFKVLDNFFLRENSKFLNGIYYNWAVVENKTKYFLYHELRPFYRKRYLGSVKRKNKKIHSFYISTQAINLLEEENIFPLKLFLNTKHPFSPKLGLLNLSVVVFLKYAKPNDQPLEVIE